MGKSLLSIFILEEDIDETFIETMKNKNVPYVVMEVQIELPVYIKCNGLIRSTVKFAEESFEIKLNPNVTIFTKETLMDEVNFSNRKIGKGSCEQKLKTIYITKET